MDGDPDRLTAAEFDPDADPDLYYTARAGHTIRLGRSGDTDGDRYTAHDDSGSFLGSGYWYADGGALYFYTWEPAEPDPGRERGQ